MIGYGLRVLSKPLFALAPSIGDCSSADHAEVIVLSANTRRPHERVA